MFLILGIITVALVIAIPAAVILTVVVLVAVKWAKDKQETLTTAKPSDAVAHNTNA